MPLARIAAGIRHYILSDAESNDVETRKIWRFRVFPHVSLTDAGPEGPVVYPDCRLPLLSITKVQWTVRKNPS